MADVKVDLERHLRHLPEEVDNTGEFIDILEKLFTLHRCILQNPNTETFRRVNSTDAHFKSIWKFEGVRLFLYNVGWRHDGNDLHLPKDDHLRAGLDTILDIRFSYPIERNEEVGQTDELEHLDDPNNNTETFLYPIDPNNALESNDQFQVQHLGEINSSNTVERNVISLRIVPVVRTISHSDSDMDLSSESDSEMDSEIDSDFESLSLSDGSSNSDFLCTNSD